MTRAELDERMREVLLALALTSNGSTANWSPSSSGDQDYTPTLGIHDAPELALAREFDAAVDDAKREQIVERAIDTLNRIKRSRTTRVVGETKRERDARIVREAEGIPAKEAAIWARCGVRDVWRARAAAGRDTELGRPAINGRSLSTRERQSRVRQMFAEGMTATAVAGALRVSYATVRRDLGRKA